MNDAGIDLHVGKGFGRWLESADATIVVTTYQAGKIVIIDHDGHAASILLRDAFAPMGIDVDGDRLAIALRESVVELESAPASGGFSHRYAPVTVHTTGDIRAHELGFGRDGLFVVDTRSSCLALLREGAPLEWVWRPRFVSAIAPEDRCHLSGLAMEDGAPAYATAHAATDTPNGWRDRKLGGGVVVDVATGVPLAGGFTMPHSPRIVGGALWLLDSGQGVLVRVDRRSGARVPIASVPGFARGLAFHRGHALVGLSKIRESNVFGGMPIASRRSELFSGVALVEVATGKVAGALRFTAGVDEVFDIAVLPGKHRVDLAL